MVETNLFVKQPMWRLRRFFNRPAVSNSSIAILIVILLGFLPIYGLLGTSNINNWWAGFSAGVITLVAALAIILFISLVGDLEFKLQDIVNGLVILAFGLYPLLILAYVIKVRVIDGKQSPLAILIGILVVIGIVIYSVAANQTSIPDKVIKAKEVGKLFDLSDCIAILGKPGSGKSTYAQFVALTFAQEKAGQPKLRKRDVARTRFGCKKWYLPILIPLRKVQGIKDEKNAQNLLLEAFRHNILPSEVREILSIDFLRYMLNKKNCLLIFDGLDEVANDNEFQVVVKEIQGLVSQYPGNKFIVTSRHSGWRGGVGSDFLQTEIRDLDTGQINNFIENWYEAIENNRRLDSSKNEVKDEKWFREKRAAEKADSLKRVLGEETSIRNLALNPLLLSMICYIHYNKQLPKERLSLYEDCSRLLLEQWDIEKGYPQDDIPLKLIQKDLIMQEIAYSMHCGKIGFGKEARGSEIIPLIRQILGRFGMEVSEAERLFSKLVSRTGVIVVAEKYKDLYAFSHLTFQEFYTARFLHTNGMNIFQVIKDIELKDSKSLTGWWREVILLYSSMQKDTSSIIVDLCNTQERDLLKRELQIAAQCFEESVTAPTEEAETLLFTKLYSIRSLGKATEKEDLSNPSFKKYLLRLSANDKYFQYVLENLVADINNEREATSAEKVLVNLLQSPDRSIQISAGKSLVELWGKYLGILIPTKELVNEILKLANFPVMLKTNRVIQETPQLIEDKEFVEEYIKKTLTKVFEEIGRRIPSFRLTRSYVDSSDQIEAFVIRQILSELVSGKFKQQKQLIGMQITQKLYQDFKEMPIDILTRLESNEDLLGKRLAYKFLLQTILQIDNEMQLKKNKSQLLDMLIAGNSEQQIWALYLLKECCPSESNVITAILEKITSPWSEVRSTAIDAARHLSLNDQQLNDVISLLNKAIEKKGWINAVKSFLTEMFLGKGETGITRSERIQIIGTLCHFIGFQERFAEFNISSEIDFPSLSKRDLTSVREDLFGDVGEKVILGQLQTKQSLHSSWEQLYSPTLYDKILNNLPIRKIVDTDMVTALLNNNEFRIRYFYASENRLIRIPEYIRILNIKVDSLDRRLLENEDFDIADDVFETLFMN
jgi:energy-coupling factor transporter ATP-binding protein EcfA2